MDGGVMGKFFINHTQKVVMDWREVFKGFYALGGKWERDGLVPSNGASAFFFCFCIPFDIYLQVVDMKISQRTVQHTLQRNLWLCFPLALPISSLELLILGAIDLFSLRLWVPRGEHGMAGP